MSSVTSSWILLTVVTLVAVMATAIGYGWGRRRSAPVVDTLEVALLANGLDHLGGEVARMGGLAEAMVADAMDAVARRDVKLARQVIERDARLDALHGEIERKAASLIGARQPDPTELRRALSAMKLAVDLERTGDLAKNIAKRALILADEPPAPSLTRPIERMGKLVSSRLRSVLDAYATADIPAAIGVWNADDEVDEHHNALFQELLEGMMADAQAVTAGAHLLFIAKNLERIGDHATNIAESIHYQVTGRALVGDNARHRPANGAPETGPDLTPEVTPPAGVPLH